jgi:hypothetical protein
MEAMAKDLEKAREHIKELTQRRSGNLRTLADCNLYKSMYYKEKKRGASLTESLNEVWGSE